MKTNCFVPLLDVIWDIYSVFDLWGLSSPGDAEKLISLEEAEFLSWLEASDECGVASTPQSRFQSETQLDANGVLLVGMKRGNCSVRG